MADQVYAYAVLDMRAFAGVSLDLPPGFKRFRAIDQDSMPDLDEALFAWQGNSWPACVAQANWLERTDGGRRISASDRPQVPNRPMRHARGQASQLALAKAKRMDGNLAAIRRQTA